MQCMSSSFLLLLLVSVEVFVVCCMLLFRQYCLRSCVVLGISIPEIVSFPCIQWTPVGNGCGCQLRRVLDRFYLFDKFTGTLEIVRRRRVERVWAFPCFVDRERTYPGLPSRCCVQGI